MGNGNGEDKYLPEKLTYSLGGSDIAFLHLSRSNFALRYHHPFCSMKKALLGIDRLLGNQAQHAAQLSSRESIGSNS